jgi:hypothetical protein
MMFCGDISVLGPSHEHSLSFSERRHVEFLLTFKKRNKVTMVSVVSLIIVTTIISTFLPITQESFKKETLNAHLCLLHLQNATNKNNELKNNIRLQ